jgi:MOSC domain-containing protein YiiM
MVRHQSIEIFARAGLAGDFGRKPGKAQVTIVSAERWAAACAALGADLPWTARRANLLVSGIDLDVVPGRQLAIGRVVLQITGETDPCHRMEEARAGLRAALTPDARGGVRCRVIAGGRIGVGDTVTILEDLFSLIQSKESTG